MLSSGVTMPLVASTAACFVFQGKTEFLLWQHVFLWRSHSSDACLSFLYHCVTIRVVNTFQLTRGFDAGECHHLIISLPGFSGRAGYQCAEIECGHRWVFARFAHDDETGFPVCIYPVRNNIASTFSPTVGVFCASASSPRKESTNGYSTYFYYQ